MADAVSRQTVWVESGVIKTVPNTGPESGIIVNHGALIKADVDFAR